MHELNLKLTVLALLFIPSLASAQVWLPERASKEGAGVKLGSSLVLHPGFGIEGGIDTNALRKSKDSSNGTPGAGRMRITPFLDLSTRSDKRRTQDTGDNNAAKPKLTFKLGVAGFYDWYFSKLATVNSQNNFGIDAALNFALFPEGTFSVFADATYSRSQKPYESSSEHWSWHEIHPGLGFRVRPGGGTLSFELSYGTMLLLYEDKKIASTNNSHTHFIRFMNSWRIFPKTSIITKISFSPVIYNNNASPTAGEAYVFSANVSSMPVRALTGIRGLFAQRFGMSLFAGYGASFYESGDNFDGLIASGELMFYMGSTGNIRLGGTRDFVDSFYSNYFTQTGGYLKYEQMFGRLVLASLKGDLNYREYSTVASTSSDPSAEISQRNELWTGATLLVEVRATGWLSFFVSGVYQANITNYMTPLDIPTKDKKDDPKTTEVDYFPVDFHRFEAMAGVKVHY